MTGRNTLCSLEQPSDATLSTAKTPNQMSDCLMIHAGPRGGYRIDCPACKSARPGCISELPPDFSRPFDFVCACGHSFKVFINIRSHRRKPCRLSGEYTLMHHGRQIDGLCTLLDLSQAGARVEANHLTNIEIGTLLRLIVTLDDASHSRILISGRIRSVVAQLKQVTMGIQFEPLELHSQKMLGFYLL